MEASKQMIVAFGKAEAANRLDHFQWQDDKQTTFTANLKSIDIDTIDLTQAKLTYELYDETELTSEFTITASVELTLWYDGLSRLDIQPISLLNKGLKEGAIRQYTEGYYSLIGAPSTSRIIGLVGEEEGVERYLKDLANDN